MSQKGKYWNRCHTNENKKKRVNARHRISEGISMDGSSKKVRRFTKGGGCRWLFYFVGCEGRMVLRNCPFASFIKAQYRL